MTTPTTYCIAETDKIMPTHWIAGTEGITPVVIVEAGTGGQELTYVPPDPVIVRSINDYFEFVASEGALFTDRGLAMKESNRLKDEEVSRARALLAQIERREAIEEIRRQQEEDLAQDRNRSAKSERSMVSFGALSRLEPQILEDSGSSSSQPVVQVSSINTVEPPVEVVVVTKKRTQEKEIEKPTTLLGRILYVIGRETLSFDEICQRLKARDWFPQRRSSVSNVISGHKNQFNCPAKSIYALRNKPKVSPVETDEVTLREAESSEDPAPDETDGAESSPMILEADYEVVEDEDADPEEEVSEPEEDAELEVKAQDDLPVVEEEPISEFDTWLGLPMTSLSPKRAHYHDDGIVLAEKHSSDGKWTAEIYVSGLELWYSGNSEDRQGARDEAQKSLTARIQSVNDNVQRLQGL